MRQKQKRAADMTSLEISVRVSPLRPLGPDREAQVWAAQAAGVLS